MNIFEDERIVMTLDAGGTNFVFSAIQRGKEIIEPITYSSNAHDLMLCLKTLIKGFEQVRAQLPSSPVAISFAFPGPADYKAGIIGKLPNLPAFTEEGVALGPMLEDHFQLPTFIGNNGNLFAYAEAMAGALPFINHELQARQSNKQYTNLLGITLGTGFGAGVVVNNTLCEGDNSAGGEIWLTRNYKTPATYAETSVSIKSIKQLYGQLTKQPEHNLTPKEIYDIATGTVNGNKEAALKAFDNMAAVMAESLANAITLIDGIIVIGGGMAGAYPLLAPRIIHYMNGSIQNLEGHNLPRLIGKVYDLEDPASLAAFLDYENTEISVPLSNRKVAYAKEKRIGLCLSKLGTNQAICLGAYAIALKNLSTQETEKQKVVNTLKIS